MWRSKDVPGRMKANINYIFENQRRDMQENQALKPCAYFRWLARLIFGGGAGGFPACVYDK